MRVRVLNLLASFAITAIAPSAAFAIDPETVGKTTMGEPTTKWFMAKSAFGAGYIFDGESGEMMGLISLSTFTPAVQPNLKRGEIYAAETYYSRLYHGERSDVLTIYDLETLSPGFEIEIPKKVAALSFRQYIALLDDDRHLAIFNMTPAQSVSIVDVRSRDFVGEISTPGCALILPVADRAFLMICGDGTLQLVGLDRNGGESKRIRSDAFFTIDEDPVFDKPVPTADGWQLVTYEGKIFEVTVANDSIQISEPWSVLSAEDSDEKWRVGGGQLMDVHVGMDLLFMMMHQGEVDTHEEPGTEIWIFNRETQRRIARIETAEPITNILVSQDEDPILIVTTQAGPVHIYDVKTTRKLRTIDNAGTFPSLLQRF